MYILYTHRPNDGNLAARRPRAFIIVIRTRYDSTTFSFTNIILFCYHTIIRPLGDEFTTVYKTTLAAVTSHCVAIRRSRDEQYKSIFDEHYIGRRNAITSNNTIDDRPRRYSVN